MNNNIMLDSSVQTHSPYLAGNLRKPGHQGTHDYPANLLKFNAWVGKLKDDATGQILVDFDKGVEIIKKKHLVLGEPAVVPIIYTHLDGSTTVELVFGIGSADPENPFIHCSTDNSIVNETRIDTGDVDEEGNKIYAPLIDILNGFMSRENAEDIIKQGLVDAIKDPDVMEQMANAVAGSEVINRIISDKLRWRPISELISKIEVETEPENPEENI